MTTKLTLLLSITVAISSSLFTTSSEAIISYAEAKGNLNPEFSGTPDFVNIEDRKERKRVFINYINSKANPILHRIRKERTVLISLYLRHRSGEVLSDSEQQWVLRLAKLRKVNSFDSDTDIEWDKLLIRTDTIPLSLLLAQAALESSWGTSRFAKQGNNYFGIWCFTPGCGIVPKKRTDGDSHEVEAYTDIDSAIEKYIHILNTGTAFEELRSLRYEQREKLLTPSGTFMLNGLKRYAENGGEYMRTLETLIRQNSLGEYD